MPYVRMDNGEVSVVDSYWSIGTLAASLIGGLLLAGCSTATRLPTQGDVPAVSQGGAPRTPAEQAKADNGRPPYTPADVHFMQGMISHHAQALIMAGWAPTHGASESVKVLAARIDVGQREEIAFMQRWLRERNETVPEADSGHDMAGHQMSTPGMSTPGMSTPGMSTPGMSMPALMPGMLTPEQMAQLSAGTGAEFDRLFLTFMIQHHQGALAMVAQLFSSQGAGQDGRIFRFASDVDADQTTEINRMRTMLTPPAH